MINKYIFLILSLVYISYAVAGEVDLQIELNIPETNNLNFGEVLNFNVTISNFGPDDSAGNSTAFNPNAIFIGSILENNGFPELILSQDSSIDQECFLVPVFIEPPPMSDAQPSIEYIFSYPILLANQSITCYGSVQIFLEQGQKELIFRAGVFQLDTDSNLNNNFIEVLFGIKPRTIPVNNMFSLITMLILLLLIGQNYIRKQTKI